MQFLQGRVPGVLAEAEQRDGRPAGERRPRVVGEQPVEQRRGGTQVAVGRVPHPLHHRQALVAQLGAQLRQQARQRPQLVPAHPAGRHVQRGRQSVAQPDHRLRGLRVGGQPPVGDDPFEQFAGGAVVQRGEHQFGGGVGQVVQRTVARDDHHAVAGGRQQRHHLGGVPRVVDHHDQPPARGQRPELPAARLERGREQLRRRAQRPHELSEHVAGVQFAAHPEVVQVDRQHIGEPVGQPAGDPEREFRLPRTARAAQRQDRRPGPLPPLLHRAEGPGPFHVPVDEMHWLGRKFNRHTGPTPIRPRGTVPIRRTRPSPALARGCPSVPTLEVRPDTGRTTASRGRVPRRRWRSAGRGRSGGVRGHGAAARPAHIRLCGAMTGFFPRGFFSGKNQKSITRVRSVRLVLPTASGVLPGRLPTRSPLRRSGARGAAGQSVSGAEAEPGTGTESPTAEGAAGLPCRAAARARGTARPQPRADRMVPVSPPGSTAVDAPSREAAGPGRTIAVCVLRPTAPRGPRPGARLPPGLPERCPRAGRCRRSGTVRGGRGRER